MPAAVIFDLDGTLLDTEPDFSLLLNRLLEQHARDPVTRTRVRETVSSGSRALVRMSFGLEENDPRLEPLLAEFLDMYAGHIPHTRAALFDDIDALIANVHAAGLPWGIMTNKPRRFTAPLLAHFDTFGTCASLKCPDDVQASKPNPAGILRVCEELDVPPCEVVYVGDHPRDIEAARNAGMAGIAVRWGYLPADSRIESWGADFIADDPSALSNHLLP